MTTVKIDTRELDKIQSNFKNKSEQVLAAVAFQVEAEAKARAPVGETGALKNSIHTEKKNSRLYWVADGVEYGIYQEFGTSKMAAQPFLTPAIDKVSSLLDKLFGAIIE